MTLKWQLIVGANYRTTIFKREAWQKWPKFSHLTLKVGQFGVFICMAVLVSISIGLIHDSCQLVFSIIVTQIIHVLCWWGKHWKN